MHTYLRSLLREVIVMIALMMTIGITLRNSSIPKYYLTIPYFAMGAILLIGSVQFYRQFILLFPKRTAVCSIAAKKIPP